MNILFLAPLPPPISGHSIASEVIHDYLRRVHNITVVDLSIASANDGTVTYRRSTEVLKALFQIWKKKGNADAIYLTISESLAGNIKDLLIYLICFKKLNKLFIHLHGGTIKKMLLDVYPLLRWLNSFAIHRMAGVIISGRSHANIFAAMIDNHRIHIIPNFAQDNLFVDEVLVKKKFSNFGVLRLVYISGMSVGKGYLNLLEAYKNLDDEIKNNVIIDFAGKFDSVSRHAEFIQQISDIPSITYHGVVDDAFKKSLFAKAHIFCLPTTFLEGQPISILEAYASGCVVVTTGQAGIYDIFTDGINGYLIEPHDSRSIELIIEKLHSSSIDLVEIAQNNRMTAISRYRTEVFTKRVGSVLTSLSNSNSNN
jgi:glycosyltransferase involved in cell wall biosynthesis